MLNDWIITIPLFYPIRSGLLERIAIIYFAAASIVLHSIMLAFAVVVIFDFAHFYINHQEALQHGF